MDTNAEFKSLDLRLKAVADESPNGAFEAILSTPDVDRDGETVAAGAFEPLPASIPIYWNHAWTKGAKPIGRGVPFYDGDVLKVKGMYASSPEAQEVRQLVLDDVVDTMSAGFLTSKRKGKAILAGELIEGSITGIPVNAGAKMLAAKALDDADVKAGARNSKTDQQHLQAAHDSLVSAGATCGSMKSLKALVGSVEALQDRVRDALEDAYVAEDSYGFVSVRGVVPDGDAGGYVVFQGYGLAGLDVDETYRQSYADDGAVVTLSGAAEIVDVHEVITPDADADREGTKSMTEAAGAPADEAAAPAAEGEEVTDLELRLRAMADLAAVAAL